ncbi:transporter substrate-binding domain-containing protein [Pelomonas sp. SE-A7]|uniref:substrate-binding periplasmic protein n=1 Tax=Pelomonas sp. SE-A7 TaxID=3054953 RepID=UPI00259D1B31|nr:transporter substrate-binding domain-containing protein [Pelomonas sp. SE-A7]MDM4765862.1 transporter substrate-binding domain-containing protein [Pelomonas sp. SE-A7]
MLLLAWLGILSCQAAEPLILLVAETPGVFIKDASSGFSGPGIDRMRRMAQLAGLDEPRFEWTIAPRALLDTATRPGTCFVGLGRSPEREAQYQWAGPISRAELVLVARPDDNRKLASLAEAREMTLGVIRNSVAARQLQASGMHLEEVADDATNVRKLMARRIDLWAANGYVVAKELQHLPEPHPRVVLRFGLIETYVACHLQLSRDTMAVLRQALATMIREGAFSTVKP